jgi:glycerol-3-phosphate O-acyltransferase
MDRATHWIDRLRKEADRGRLYLSDTLRIQGVEQWVSSGMQNLGTFHEKNVVMREKGYFTTEDMNLLYYYRNRLTGYGFGWLSGEETEVEWSRLEDEKGFLV